MCPERRHSEFDVLDPILRRSAITTLGLTPRTKLELGSRLRNRCGTVIAFIRVYLHTESCKGASVGEFKRKGNNQMGRSASSSLIKASSAPALHRLHPFRAISEPAESSSVSSLLVSSRRAGIGRWRTGAFVAGSFCGVRFGVWVVRRGVIARRRGVGAFSCAGR